MTREDIPDDVRRFILTSIKSVPMLEAILLMRGERGTPWDAKHLAQRLYIPEKTAAAILGDLHGAGFIRAIAGAEGTFHFDPISPELDAMCASLQKTYSDNMIGVTNLIHSNVGKRAQQFADAFKWRKD